ncbi:hypothetical protein MRB53_040504 [Persea americana]|nr:hypothetical protein MRB53_040504 [Persea americana]
MQATAERIKGDSCSGGAPGGGPTRHSERSQADTSHRWQDSAEPIAGLALHFGRLALHQLHQALYKLVLCLGQPFSVGAVDGDVAEGGAVADCHRSGVMLREGTGGVPLHSHVFAFWRDASEVLMHPTVLCVPCFPRVWRDWCDAPDSVALHFDVGAVHLPDEGRQPAEGDDEGFVLS